MTKWEYLAISPDDWRDIRFICDSWDSKLKEMLPAPKTPHCFHPNPPGKSEIRIGSHNRYRVISPSSQGGYWHTWEGWLNDLGKDGWEVCSAGGWGTRGEIGYNVILKRSLD